MWCTQIGEVYFRVAGMDPTDSIRVIKCSEAFLKDRGWSWGWSESISSPTKLNWFQNLRSSFASKDYFFNSKKNIYSYTCLKNGPEILAIQNSDTFPKSFKIRELFQAFQNPRTFPSLSKSEDFSKPFKIRGLFQAFQNPISFPSFSKPRTFPRLSISENFSK